MMLTCICMTHGRPWLVAESLECWRRQEHVDGVTSQFLLYNDCPEQPLRCDLPGVRAINYPYPITDLCVKQNLAVLCADGDWVLPWDDDDIFLPHRIAVTARYIRDNPDMRAFRQTRAWYSEDDAIQKRGNNSLYFGSAAVDRSYYFTCGGASSGANHMGFNDESTWTALEAGGKAREIEPNTADTFFWYRWTGRDLGAHDSTQKKETIGNNCYQRHAYFRKVTLGDPRFRRGPQTIEPIWAKGYTRMVRDAIAAGKGDVI